MKAAIFKGKGTSRSRTGPKPTIVEPTDAIVRVVLACVCGSDLWFYRGISDLPHGGVGHEFIGVVDEIGDDVSDLSVGDFVICAVLVERRHLPQLRGTASTPPASTAGSSARAARATAARPSTSASRRPTAPWSRSPAATSPTRPWPRCSP